MQNTEIIECFVILTLQNKSRVVLQIKERLTMNFYVSLLFRLKKLAASLFRFYLGLPSKKTAIVPLPQ